jgi:hypothetical protein
MADREAELSLANGDRIVLRKYEIGGPKATALELLGSGEYVVCMGLGLTLAAESPRSPKTAGSVLKVRVQTRHEANQVTAEQAASELENAESGVTEIAERSRVCAELIGTRQILYELIDDYVMGAVRLAFKDGTGLHLVSQKRQ